MISVLLLCFLISSAASSPTEVIHLSDTSFEHDTQASSGKTTGIWAILLSSPSIGQRHDLAMQLWAKLAENEEKSDTEPIYATVDLDKNKAVAARVRAPLCEPCESTPQHDQEHFSLFSSSISSPLSPLSYSSVTRAKVKSL